MSELNLAIGIEGTYHGDIVSSDRKQVEECSISVKSLNKVLVKVDFTLGEEIYSFRGMLSDQEEGVLMIIQEKVSDDFIISGVSGFLYQKPNVHGGFINQLNSFYFHIILDRFDGKHQEIYYLGQRPGESKPGNKLKKDLLQHPSYIFSTIK